MENNEIIESFFNGSDWNSIVQNFELVKGYILAIGKLFWDWTFENLNIFIKWLELLTDWL